MNWARFDGVGTGTDASGAICTGATGGWPGSSGPTIGGVVTMYTSVTSGPNDPSDSCATRFSVALCANTIAPSTGNRERLVRGSVPSTVAKTRAPSAGMVTLIVGGETNRP